MNAATQFIVRKTPVTMDLDEIEHIVAQELNPTSPEDVLTSPEGAPSPLAIEERPEEGTLESEEFSWENESPSEEESDRDASAQDTPSTIPETPSESTPDKRGSSSRQVGPEDLATYKKTASVVGHLYEKIKEYSEAKRECYRKMGLAINSAKEQVKNKKYGKQIIPRLETELGICETNLNYACQYAQIDPERESRVPKGLAHLSWRRVTRILTKVKSSEAFDQLLKECPQIAGLKDTAFEALLKERYPRQIMGTDETDLSDETITQAGDEAQGLGDDGSDDGSPPDDEPTPSLPEPVARAQESLKNEASELAERVRFYSGREGFTIEMTLHSIEECVQIAHHLIHHLEG